MQLGKVSLAVHALGLVGLSSLSPAASAQELSSGASSPKPASALAGAMPDTNTAPLIGEQASKTARTSEIGGAEVGQRLKRQDLVPNRQPLDRIDNRIANRVENRIDNRIDRDQDVDQGSTAAYEIATVRIRTATEATAH